MGAVQSAVQTLVGSGVAARPGAALSVCARLGRYVVVSRIGAGAMGVVFEAYDPGLGRKVALKVVRAAGSKLAEARALARLAHPNIVTIHDVGMAGDYLWLAMELLQGQTLRQWLARPDRPWRDTLRVLVPAAEGLDAAHEAGLVHRDFKPENVMLGPAGSVRVMDFGLARLVDAEHAVTEPCGSPPYMAPECFDGAGDERADQFAFCVVLWEALYGERPFAGQSALEVARAIVDGDLRRPRRAAPRWLHRIVVRGLDPDPDERWPSMQALLGALRRGRARARIGKGVLAVGLAGAVGLGALGVDAGIERHRLAACERAGAEIERTWSADEETDPHVRPWLDGYATAWAAAKTETCVAANVTGRWDLATAHRAAQCLEDRRVHLDALVTELQHADAVNEVAASWAAAELPDVAPCRDQGWLARIPTPPPDRAAAIATTTAALARARALQVTAGTNDALDAARRAHVDARAIGWPRLTAAADLTLGELLLRRGEAEEAEPLLEAAYFGGATHGAPEEAHAAAAALVEVTGIHLGRTEDGLTWARHAAVVRVHLPDESNLHEADVLQRTGRLHALAGNHDLAQTHLEEATAILEATDRIHPDRLDATRTLAREYTTRANRARRAKSLAAKTGE